MPPNEDFIRILHASVAPCVLISGIGLLLLSIVNRLGRPIDRIRLLCREMEKADANAAPLIRDQILILFRRCRYLQASVAFAIASIFFASIIILLLFAGFVVNIPVQSLAKLFFTSSIISLIISLIFFLLDISTTLRSVAIEIKKTLKI